MFKKLVKYGNSNALILDKPILELLNIAEGSIVKISTDGRSIIITPQQEAAGQHVNETITAHDALHMVGICGSIAHYKNFDPATQKMLEEEFREIFTKHKATQVACGAMMQSPEYLHQAQLLSEKFQDDQESVEFIEAMKKLIYKFCPEMEQLHKELEVIGKKYGNV